MALITEHSASLRIELPAGDVHSRMEVFYNPVMKSNRNISILLLNSIRREKMKIADPLAGSGIRSLRFWRELKKGKIEKIYVNDAKENFRQVFKKNLKLNQIKNQGKISLHQEEASLFLLHQPGFDYIDLDPFGSPNPFLAAAIARISRQGILAVTATDTAALTGTYPSATRRKYWASPLKNYLMHEVGLRILIRRIQLQGVQFEKALVPILTYQKEHYFRVYVQNTKGKTACDEIIKQHQYFLFCSGCLNFKTSFFNKEQCDCGKEFLFAGPLWGGKLCHQGLVAKMVQENPYPEEQKFLELLLQESALEQVGFYDVHEVAQRLKMNPLKMGVVLKKLPGVRTHFLKTGVKSKKSIREVMKLLRA